MHDGLWFAILLPVAVALVILTATLSAARFAHYSLYIGAHVKRPLCKSAIIHDASLQIKRDQSQGSDKGENGEEPISPTDPNVHPPLNQGVVWGPLVRVQDFLLWRSYYRASQCSNGVRLPL
jgi:hypothetical protein